MLYKQIGFTGTERGMTHAQALSFLKIILSENPTFFHHGDCIGSDAEAHDIIQFQTPASIIIHPPEDPKARAFCTGWTEMRTEAPYLVRNHHIVDETSILIGTPGEDHEVLRSGTWATIRYAREKKNRKIYTIFPDGLTTIFQNKTFSV